MTKEYIKQVNKKIWFSIFSFCFLFLFFGMTPVRAITTEDVKIHYSFDVDCSDNISNNDLVIFGGLTSTSTTGKFNNSLYINGAGIYNGTPTGCYKEDDISSNLFNNWVTEPSKNEGYIPTFTYSFWLKIGNIPTGDSNDDSIIFHHGRGDRNSNFVFSLHKNRKFRFAFDYSDNCNSTKNGTVIWYSNNEIDTWNSDNWINVVIQGTGGNFTNTFKVFVNNEEVTGTWDNETNANKCAEPAESHGDGAFVIGSRSNTFRSSAYNGYIDDFVGFNKLLTTDEIEQLSVCSLDDILSGNCIDNLNIFARADLTKEAITEGQKYSFKVSYDFCEEYQTLLSTSTVPSKKITALVKDSATNNILATAEEFLDLNFLPYACNNYDIDRDVFAYNVGYDPTDPPYNTGGGTYYIEIVDSISTSTILYSGHEILDIPYDVISYVERGNFLNKNFSSSDYYTPLATSTINISYNFKNLPFNGGKICLIDTNASSTLNWYDDDFENIACINTTATSTNSLDFSFLGKNYGQKINARLIGYTSSGNAFIASNIFNLKFYDQNFNDLTGEKIFGKEIKFVVCNAEEWAEAEEATSFFNWTKIKCSTGKTALEIIVKISDIIKELVETMAEQLKIIFPISTLNKFFECWELSEAKTLPENIAWLQMTDENNDLTVQVPESWVGNTSTKVVLWGDTMFKNGDPTIALWAARIRSLTTWIQLAAVLLLVWVITNNAMNDLKEKNKE